MGPRNDRCGRWPAPGLRFPPVIARADRPVAIRHSAGSHLPQRTALPFEPLPCACLQLRSGAEVPARGTDCHVASLLAMTQTAVRGPFVGLCGDLTVFPGEIGHFFVLTIPCAYYIVNKISIGKRLFQSKIYDRRRLPAKAIRTAGSNAENRRGGGWQLLLPY